MCHRPIVLPPPSRAPYALLSPREREIVSLVLAGLRPGDIAAALSVSPATVKRHLKRTYQRVGVSDRTQLAVWAWWAMGVY